MCGSDTLTKVSSVHRVRFPTPKGAVAAPAHAWGAEFDIVIARHAAPFEECGDYAVVDVSGPLAQHVDPLLCSYDVLRTRVAAAVESSCPAVCLRINSPGGDFAGMLEASAELRAMCQAKGKRLVAYTDSQALSAAYALALAADEIVITPSATVGSVGVWAGLCDETARDRAQGINIVIVPSGSRKADRNPHVPITEGAVAAMQAEVDTMAAMFFASVAARRPVTLEAVEALQGSSQFGAAAIKAGLADRIVTGWSEFLSTQENTGVGAMAKSTKEARAGYRAALAKLAAGEDDDAKEARSALSVMDEEDEKKEAKAKTAEDEKKEGEKEASAEEKKDDGATKSEFPEEEKKDEKAAARAPGLRLAASATANEVALAQRIHALETERAVEKENVERSALLAKRPDFSAAVRATLQASPLSVVKDACANWARLASPTEAASAALVPGGSRGESQGGESAVGNTHSVEDIIDQKMGFGKVSGGVTHSGRALTLGYMSPADVNAAADKLGIGKGNS